MDDVAMVIGPLLRKIRNERGLTLEVVAGRAGISTGFLSLVERSEKPLSRIEHWSGLAQALGVPLEQLLRLPVPAPGNGHTDRATEDMRDALNAVQVGDPGGRVLTTAALRSRIGQVHRQSRLCQFDVVSWSLPTLIRDLHTTLAAGRDLDVLLPLAVLLHVHVVRIWLTEAQAPIDLRRQAGLVGRDLAQEHNDAASLASASFGLAETFTDTGAWDLAERVLGKTEMPPVTEQTAGLVCAMLAAPRALLCAVRGDDTVAPLEEAAEIAARYGELGERDQLGYGFGPTNVAFRQIRVTLEQGDVDTAVQLVNGVQPADNPFRASQAFYWREAGRTFTLTGGSVLPALRAFQRAETLLPVKFYRDPRTREMLGELAARDRDNEELQQLAHRAGVTLG